MKCFTVTKLIRHEERVWAVDIEAARRIIHAELGKDWPLNPRVKLVSIVEEPDEMPSPQVAA